jgi:hypothetical protein
MIRIESKLTVIEEILTRDGAIFGQQKIDFLLERLKGREKEGESQ